MPVLPLELANCVAEYLPRAAAGAWLGLHLMHYWPRGERRALPDQWRPQLADVAWRCACSTSTLTEDGSAEALAELCQRNERGELAASELNEVVQCAVVRGNTATACWAAQCLRNLSIICRPSFIEAFDQAARSGHLGTLEAVAAAADHWSVTSAAVTAAAKSENSATVLALIARLCTSGNAEPFYFQALVSAAVSGRLTDAVAYVQAHEFSQMDLDDVIESAVSCGRLELAQYFAARFDYTTFNELAWYAVAHDECYEWCLQKMAETGCARDIRYEFLHASRCAGAVRLRLLYAELVAGDLIMCQRENILQTALHSYWGGGGPHREQLRAWLREWEQQ